LLLICFFFFQAEDGIRDLTVTGVQTCALPIYDRILGANDRISMAHIGIGSRGGDLTWILSQLKTSHNVEMTTVCDLWRVNREKRSEERRVGREWRHEWSAS